MCAGERCESLRLLIVFLIFSRSLGPEFGGAIGIIFFFGNIFASGLYGKQIIEQVAN